MFNPTSALIDHTIDRLQIGYYQLFGNAHSNHKDLIEQIANSTLHAIARTDALYHDLEHTILVTLVGQEILRGKQLIEGSVSPEAWVHLITALLCHDIGYVKGVCQQDCIEQQTYSTGVSNRTTHISEGATDASLTVYHVDRSKRFVLENLACFHLLDVEAIQQMIEFTRFPIPEDEFYRNTAGFPGLARSADLIGQLSDSRYLEKLPALFYEFEESGTNKALGYRHFGDLRNGYPKFFKTTVMPLIQPAIRYLKATEAGQHIVHQLYQNVQTVEQELKPIDEGHDRSTKTILSHEKYHFFLDESSVY